ncbi:MAG: glycosyltransferase family 1 protein, partial [Gemmatimonadaceae bacterium]
IDGETGLLAPPGDSAALATVISVAMDDPRRMSILAENGTAHAEREFGWDTIVSRLKETYRIAIENRTGAKLTF